MTNEPADIMARSSACQHVAGASADLPYLLLSATTDAKLKSSRTAPLLVYPQKNLSHGVLYTQHLIVSPLFGQWCHI